MNDNLNEYIKDGAVFGPADASIIKSIHMKALGGLFDPKNKIFNALRLNPSIIVGRRGSGKTAYMNSVRLADEYEIIQEIKTPSTFAKIVETIEKNTTSFLPAEIVSLFWEELFYLAMMVQVANKFRGESRELDLLRDFLARDYADIVDGSEKFLWNIVNGLSIREDASFFGAIAAIVKDSTGIDFAKAKQLAVDVLERKNIKAIVLLDSLEQYPTAIPSVVHALAGLLKCAGQFNLRNEALHIRLCLPAELYHVFVEGVSTNPLKDLSPQTTLKLHWVGGELLSVVAHRLKIYLELYHEELIGTGVELSNRDQVRAFLLRFLPERVQNSLGESEDVFAYLLRHTQLQPRHLLIYLNAIFEQQRKIDRTTYPKISADAVRVGIRTTENLLCVEVFSGYKVLYPTAQLVVTVHIPTGIFGNEGSAIPTLANVITAVRKSQADAARMRQVSITLANNA